MMALLPVWLYLSILYIEPQLWIEPMVGLPVDYAIYPLWLLVVALRGRLSDVFRFRSQDWFFIGMIAWILVSVVFNPPPSNFPEIFENYLKWFLLYRLTAAGVDSPDLLQQVAWVTLILAAVIAVETIQHLASADGTGWAGQPLAWVDASAAAIGVERRTRWVGIFDGPGVFCVMFTVALPFAMQFLSTAYALTTRLLALLFFLPLIGAGIFSTGSRGGFLTAIAIVGFWILSRFRLSFGKVVLACAIAAAGVMLGPTYLTSTKDSSNSAQHRVDMWVEGIEMVQQSPAVGIGKGNFVKYTGLLIAHNSAIEIMGETGLIGLFMWFGITYAGFKNLIRRHAETDDPRERELLIALGLSLIGYLVSSLFVTLEYETLYFVLGLTAAVRNWAKFDIVLEAADFKIIATIIVAYFVFVKGFAMMY